MAERVAVREISNATWSLTKLADHLVRKR